MIQIGMKMKNNGGNMKHTISPTKKMRMSELFISECK